MGGAALASGRFATAEDAVRYAINRAKRAELREMLEATEAEGGSYSTGEVRRHVRDHPGNRPTLARQISPSG
jgi:hypothetical protein